jgi:hypothetical protein
MCRTTVDGRPDDPCGDGCVWLVWWGVDYRGDYRTAIGGEQTDSPATMHTENIKHSKYHEVRGVHCLNAFRMGSSNSSSATKSYICTSVAFIAGIISLVIHYRVDCFTVATLVWHWMNVCQFAVVQIDMHISVFWIYDWTLVGDGLYIFTPG